MPITSRLITDIRQLDMDGLYTYADYLKWRFKERVELIKGRIFRMSPAPSRLHQEISGYLFHRIYGFIGAGGCKVYAAPFDVRFPTGDEPGDAAQTVVQPDLCVICDPAKLDDQGCLGAPDWIIEILSPGNSQKEMRNKYELYEEQGVREYWVVDPTHETVWIFVLDEKGHYQAQGPKVSTDRISPSLFPGLEIELTAVFST